MQYSDIRNSNQKRDLDVKIARGAEFSSRKTRGKALARESKLVRGQVVRGKPSQLSTSMGICLLDRPDSFRRATAQLSS